MLQHTMARATGKRRPRKSQTTRPHARTALNWLPNSERVYREIRQAILSGELPSGNRLVELSLAARYDVSRTPVREALKRLIAEDLVTVDSVRGTVVRGIDMPEVEEVYSIREVLDGLAARLAARRISQEDLARLTSLMEIMTEAVERQRQEALVQANIRFHEILYQASGNDRLVALGRSLNDFIRRFSATAFRSYERDAEVLGEHRSIVEALDRRDPERAERMARDHMIEARAFLARESISADFEGTGQSVGE